jgi:hypothetical protein
MTRAAKNLDDNLFPTEAFYIVPTQGTGSGVCPSKLRLAFLNPAINGWFCGRACRWNPLLLIVILQKIFRFETVHKSRQFGICRPSPKKGDKGKNEGYKLHYFSPIFVFC